MQKWILGTAILILAIITIGCSPDNNQLPSGKTDQEENPSPDNEILTDNNWNGDWIFLSDTVLGTLHMTSNEEAEFTYKITGSQPTTEDASPLSLTFEGSGKIDGNQAEATCESSDDCKMTIELDGSMLKLTINDELTDGSASILSGEYKKSSSIEETQLFQMNNDQFQIYGVQQGNKPSTVKAILGNPESEGPDEIMHTNWNQLYPEKELLITYYDDVVETISFTATKDALETEIAEHFEGEHYRSQDGTDYLLVPENQDLLIYHPNEDDTSKVNVFITVADENFYHNLENGEFSKVE